jgi:alpha-tubulin suppressor-like RCC1 family protein
LTSEVRRVHRAAAIPLMLLLALACEEPFRFPPPVAVLRLLPDSATIDEGQSLQLQILVQDSSGRPVDRPVAWTSSDPRVATVSRDGTVRGEAGGFAVISATVGGASDSTSVAVRAAVASVSLAPGDVDLVVGGEARYVAVPRDSSGAGIAGRAVTWTIADSGVARLTVLPAGALVTGRVPGATTLSATAGDVRRTVTITVSTVRFVSIRAAVSDHTCALTPEGHAWCWGDDLVGQLGNGDAGASAAPSRVRGGLAFAAISAGGRFTCGATVPAEAYCWGHGASGRLGSGSLDDSPVPVPVVAPGGMLEIASGWSHSCGVSPGGQASCWGNGGALGTGPLKYSTTALVVGHELQFRSAAVGGGFSCALGADGAAHCWGANRDGQLGTPAVDGSDEPVPVAGGLVFDTVAAGSWHACGLTAAGALHCWGANAWGQLGDGTITSAATPVRAVPQLTFSALSVGSGFTCALDADGRAWCWGANGSGQLGAPHTGEDCAGTPCSRAPVAVTGDLRFASLSAGGAHACGIATDGRAWCWGANVAGQLGDGTTAARATPVRVLGQR